MIGREAQRLNLARYDLAVEAAKLRFGAGTANYYEALRRAETRYWQTINGRGGPKGGERRYR